MALPQGINFRDTTGFVTDGANEYPEVSSGFDNYPVTSTQGNNVGFENAGSGLTGRDRNSGNDRRIAGYMALSGAPFEFRIDLPSTGNHNVRVACGDANYSQSCYLELFDTTTSLGVLVNATTSTSQRFLDATNTEYTQATWPGSNTAAAVTFASTICRFKTAGGSGTRPVCHVYIESAGGGDTLFAQVLT